MNFQQKLASYVLGILKDSDLIDIADTALEEGFKSTALEIVASLQTNEFSSVIQDYFKKALKELNLNFPDFEKAFTIMLHYYIEQMRIKQINVRDGINLIERLILSKLDEKEEFKKISHFYGELEVIVIDNINFEPEKDREEMINEAETKILTALLELKEKYKI